MNRSVRRSTIQNISGGFPQDLLGFSAHILYLKITLFSPETHTDLTAYIRMGRLYAKDAEQVSREMPRLASYVLGVHYLRLPTNKVCFSTDPRMGLLLTWSQNILSINESWKEAIIPPGPVTGLVGGYDFGNLILVSADLETRVEVVQTLE